MRASIWRHLVCVIFGHADPSAPATWRWSHRLAARETPDGRGTGFGMVALGKRARRRERKRARQCPRCGLEVRR